MIRKSVIAQLNEVASSAVFVISLHNAVQASSWALIATTIPALAIHADGKSHRIDEADFSG